jgi:hypothetical protein
MPFSVDNKYIMEMEQELGVIFPEKFKSKMAKENGGELLTEDDDWHLFPIFDRSDRKRISRTCNHIALESNQAKLWENFPANGIAIASNGSGDLLLLLPTKEDNKKLSDQIWIWFHESGEIEQIADNIDELIES